MRSLRVDLSSIYLSLDNWTIGMAYSQVRNNRRQRMLVQILWEPRIWLRKLQLVSWTLTSSLPHLTWCLRLVINSLLSCTLVLKFIFQTSCWIYEWVIWSLEKYGNQCFSPSLLMYASHMDFFFEMTGCKAWKAIGSKGSHAKSKGWDSHHRRHRGMHLFNMHLMKYADHFFLLKIVWSSAEAVIDGWFIIPFCWPNHLYL